MTKDISKTVVDLYYSKVDTINHKGKEYLLYKNNQLKGKDNYILGYFETTPIDTKLGKEDWTEFIVEFGITFSKGTKSKIFGDLYNVDGVGVKTKGIGFSKLMYKYFAKEKGITILGDSEQYFGARKLWSRLSKELDVVVDLYNTNADFVIEENVVLHHGNYNNDFDERLWSFSKDKNNIRSILKDIK